jgi:hypothetical protein
MLRRRLLPHERIEGRAEVLHDVLAPLAEQAA